MGVYGVCLGLYIGLYRVYIDDVFGVWNLGFRVYDVLGCWD